MGLMLLHSFVPHQHHDELTVEQNSAIHNNANTPLDILSLFFHENSEKDDFKNFKISSNQFDIQLWASLPYPFYDLFNVIAGEELDFPQTHDDTLPLFWDISSCSRRGPPVA